jgi:hypothetical protein
VCLQKLFSRSAVPAPGGGVDLNLHRGILPGRLGCLCDR